MNKAARQQKRSIIPLREVTAVHQTPHKARQFVFDITTPILHYQLATANQNEVDTWVDSISDVAFAVTHGSRSAMQQQMAPPMRQPSSPQMGLPVEQAPPPYRTRDLHPGHQQDYRFAPMGVPSVNGPPIRSQNPNPVSRPGAPFQGRLDMGGQGIQTSEEASRMMSDDNPFLPSAQELGIQENTLYSSLAEGNTHISGNYATNTVVTTVVFLPEKRYRVGIIPTESTERLRLSGEYYLLVSGTNLTLESVSTGQRLWTWPLKYLRRYGRDFTKFTFEAGRKCESGPGVFFLGTNLGNEIFHQIHANVKAIGSQQHTSLKQEDIVRASGSSVPVRRGTMPAPVSSYYPGAPRAPPALPAQRPLSRAYSDLNQQRLEETQKAPPQFAQEVTTEEYDAEPEHLYEEGEDSTLATAFNAARTASYDIMQIANGTPVPRPMSATSTSQQAQRRARGYDRLVLAGTEPEPLYDEAELDSLMANIALHTGDSSGYNTLVRDISTARPAHGEQNPKKSATIDDEDLAQLDDLLRDLRQDEETVDDRSSSKQSKGGYDYLPPPRKADGLVSDDQVRGDTAGTNTGYARYQNVSTEQVDTGLLPAYMNVVSDYANDEFELSESEELALDDYTPLEEKERIPAKPPRTIVPYFLDTELDDPEYGVPKLTHL